MPPKQLEGEVDPSAEPHAADAGAEVAAGEVPAIATPPLTMPATAGEPDEVSDPGGDEDLAKMVKPASGSVAKGS